MRSRSRFATPGDTDTLIHAWYAAMDRDAWRDFDEWRLPAVDAVAESLLEGRDVEPAARRLGGQRADAGVSIREGLHDLELLYRVRLRAEPPHAITLAFADGWAEAEIATLLGRAALDPLTGLNTFDYLCARLGEIYAEPRELDDRCLLFADPDRYGAEGLARSLGLAELMRSVFVSGEPTAILPNGMMVAVADRTALLRDQLDRLVSHSRARIWMEALPPRRDLAEELLADLGRA